MFAVIINHYIFMSSSIFFFSIISALNAEIVREVIDTLNDRERLILGRPSCYKFYGHLITEIHSSKWICGISRKVQWNFPLSAGVQMLLQRGCNSQGITKLLVCMENQRDWTSATLLLSGETLRTVFSEKNYSNLCTFCFAFHPLVNLQE